jgi:uroporphyrinogen decarboxylase
VYISHKRRLETCLSGSIPDRTPVALWRHFPVDDQTPGGLAAATVNFQRTYDFDLVKVTPTSSFCVKDWGVEDDWRGNTEGTRDYTSVVVNTAQDWLDLPVLEPSRGYLAAQLECLRLIINELGPDTPVIQTIFSPLSQARHLVGDDQLMVHLRRYPQALQAGLKTIAQSTQRFVEAAKKLGIAGIFFAAQQARYSICSEQEYERFGCTYDLQILETAQDLWLNMLHLHGEEVMFKRLSQYPVQIINWHDRDTSPSLTEAQMQFQGAVCGGLQRWNTMVIGSVQGVEAEATNAIQVTGGKRFILGTGCVLPIISPSGNIMAARKIVDKQRN